MTLFDVLAPEGFGLEKLSTFRGLAPVLGVVLLLHILQKLILKRLVNGLAAELAEIDALRL